jgi:hypothetical protein
VSTANEARSRSPLFEGCGHPFIAAVAPKTGGGQGGDDRPPPGAPRPGRLFVGFLANETADRLIFFRCLCGEAKDRSGAACTLLAERRDLAEG